MLLLLFLLVNLFISHCYMICAVLISCKMNINTFVVALVMRYVWIAVYSIKQSESFPNQFLFLLNPYTLAIVKSVMHYQFMPSRTTII